MFEVYLEILNWIPEGKVISYKQFALFCGMPVRAAAQLLAKNPWPDKYACYKVVHEDGSVGGYSLGVEEKVRRLREDGVPLKDFKVPLDAFWRPKLNEIWQRLQGLIASRAEIKPLGKADRVAAVDLAYKHNKAIAAAVVFENNEKVEENYFTCKVNIPYIPTFLAFREAYPAAKALEELKFDVVLVDGHGMLHPRFAGFATHLGVIMDVATIGIAKSYLCGTERNGKLYVNDKPVGTRYDKLYVSLGNKVTLEDLKLVKQFEIKSGMVLPVYEAHSLAARIRSGFMI